MSLLWKVPLRLLKVPLAFAAGIGWQYLFDPVSGRGRRTRIRDQIYARARQGGRLAAKRARYKAGQARGAVHRAMPTRPGNGDIDDELLLQKIRSEALGPAKAGAVDVEVHSGVVVLRGASHDADAERALMERIAAVGGVRQVNNQLI